MHMPSTQVRQGGKRLAPLLVGFALVLSLLVLCFAPLFHGLAIHDGRTGERLMLLPIWTGEAFSIRYTHSVNLTPVTDTLRFTGQGLVLESTLFTSYGWGMPVLADGIGSHFENTPEGFLITGIDRAQPDVPILLQQVPDHHLLYRDREISLLGLAGSGAFLRLGPEPASLAALLFARA